MAESQLLAIVFKFTIFFDSFFPHSTESTSMTGEVDLPYHIPVLRCGYQLASDSTAVSTNTVIMIPDSTAVSTNITWCEFALPQVLIVAKVTLAQPVPNLAT